MRKKSWKQVAAIVICAALLSGCTGENGQKKNTGRKEGQVVNIYCCLNCNPRFHTRYLG